MKGSSAAVLLCRLLWQAIFPGCCNEVALNKLGGVPRAHMDIMFILSTYPRAHDMLHYAHHVSQSTCRVLQSVKRSRVCVTSHTNNIYDTVVTMCPGTQVRNFCLPHLIQVVLISSAKGIELWQQNMEGLRICTPYQTSPRTQACKACLLLTAG